MAKLETLLELFRNGTIVFPSGRKVSFTRSTPIPAHVLDAFEANAARPLPRLFRDLLENVGAAELFAGQDGGLELLDPRTLHERFMNYFEDPPMALRESIPVAFDTYLQELIVWFPRRPQDACVVAVSHELVPDDWESSADAESLWTTFDRWLDEAIATEGRMKPH
jgi:hypothetical protein